MLANAAFVNTVRTTVARSRSESPHRPTTVPGDPRLRTRPTCSSIRRQLPRRPGALDRLSDDRGDLTPYSETRCWAAAPSTVYLAQVGSVEAIRRSDDRIGDGCAALDGSSSTLRAPTASVSSTPPRPQWRSHARHWLLFDRVGARWPDRVAGRPAKSNKKRVAGTAQLVIGVAAHPLSVNSINSQWIRSPTRWSMNQATSSASHAPQIPPRR